MKKLNPLFALLTFSFATQTPTAWAGVESSAGGADDFRPVPAFFRMRGNHTPIKICQEVGKDFGVPGSSLVQMIDRSFRAWESYIFKKKINIGAGYYFIQTKTEWLSRCDGTQNLAFYFGVENEDVKKYKSQFSKPFGFAQLTRAENEQGGDAYSALDAQGFIWIAPPMSVDAEKKIPVWNPNSAPALEALILHEVGHVFGNSHVDGTVMTANIGQYLENDTVGYGAPLNLTQYQKIDAKIELVLCIECKASFNAIETFDPVQPTGQSESDWIKTFRLLTGLEPQGPVSIHFERSGAFTGDGSLYLADAVQKYEFKVELINQIAEFIDNAPLFLGLGDSSPKLFSKGITYFASIQPLVGAPLFVGLSYNMDRRKVKIMPLGSSHSYYPAPIFVSE